MKNKWFTSLFRRRMIIVLLILLQIALMILTIAERSGAYTLLNFSLRVLSLVVCLNVASKDGGGAFKLTWVYIIMMFPVFGGLFYVFFKYQTQTKRIRLEIEKKNRKGLIYNSGNINHYNSALASIDNHQNTVRYLYKHNKFPVFSNSETEYLSPGEVKFEKLLYELEKAERFIFIEYFIIGEGQLWDSIFEILKRKAQDGVTVRILYDDMGCFLMIPKSFKKQMNKYGIECAVFNPFKPFLTSIQNNRDHRKIVVIDGKTAFTGGVNISDYYANIYQKHGHWKDAAIMIKGEAVRTFTLMFLQMWELVTKADENYGKYLSDSNANNNITSDSFVQPYCDSPMDGENVCEHVYMQIINNAKEYVYINTPYLIIDDSMLSALCLAAKSGVDVRIVTPGIWDKWAIHMTTRSYYKTLIEAGVKVYEYTPGFIHSKTFVSDDLVATVGSANLDFRSLYLHFECGVVIYNGNTISNIKNDFLSTLDKCKLISFEDCKCGFFMSIFRKTMRIIAPIL